MGVSKESIRKFLIGNRFHVKLRKFADRFLAYTHRGKYIQNIQYLLYQYPMTFFQGTI